MRLTAYAAGLFLCAVVFINTSAPASANPIEQVPLDSNAALESNRTALEVVNKQLKESQAPVVRPLLEHVVSGGDTLIAIAQEHNTSWQRVYDKNPQIIDPDILVVGEKLVVPQPDEQLVQRIMPEPSSAKVGTAVVVKQKPKTVQKAAVAKAVRGSSGGNSYVYGYCTWYAKSRRPDLPNNLGNAVTWVARAQAQGIATGSAPRVGAVGQKGNHVVYVEQVNSDGTVTISEMNRQGVGIQSSRTVPANYFIYIY